MNLFLILPILIPFFTAILLLLIQKQPQVQRGLSLLGAFLLVGAAFGLLADVTQQGIQVAQMGNWPAPYGITLVADLFSAIMIMLTALMGLAVVAYSLVSIDSDHENFGYYPILQVLLMGIAGAFLTGDIFNLYVWFEVLLIASFVLLALGGERSQIEGAIKYVTLNLLSSAIFLAAVGIIYGVAGTLNMADLAMRLDGLNQPGLVTTVSMIFLVAFGIKAAVFPFFFWLPASYHTPPAAVSAIFAGLLTKVGVYALIRVFTLIFTQNTDYAGAIILTIAGLTMVLGILGAVAQNEMRRILSFNLVSHIGYIVMGLGLSMGLGLERLASLALAGSIFYIIHDVVVKTNLFLISGSVERLQGTALLKKSGGLYISKPGLAALFLIPALSLSGIPPLSGFWPKLALLQAGLALGQYAIVAAALLVSLLTLYTMTKIWSEVFWKEPPESNELPPQTPSNWRLSLVPICILALLTIIIGLAAEPVFTLAQTAAEQLLEPSYYIETVLGGLS